MDPIALDKTQKVKIIDQSLVSTSGSVQAGMDYQGIEWDVIMPGIGRKFYRRQRDLKFKPYRNGIGELKKHSRKQKLPKNSIYDFSKYYRNLPTLVGHFQLRYNLVAISKYDFLHVKQDGIYKFSTLDHDTKDFNYADDFTPVCLGYADGYAVSGGFEGELAVYDLEANKVRFFGKTTEGDHILNCSHIYKEDGQLKILTGANDCYLRMYNIKYFKEPSLSFKFDTAVNNCSVSPANSNIIAVCCDQNETEILDIRLNKVVMKLYGHEDYTFASDWHPNGLFLATGNQDLTCRVWDMRKVSTEYHILPSEVASVSNVKFAAGGQYLIFSEAIDYVSIYDFQKECEVYQKIDVFGEITGMDVTPGDNETLFFGVRLKDYEGVFEYTLKKGSMTKMVEESFI